MVAPLAKMSDIEDNSPPGTYKTTVSINGGENKPVELFNLLPVKGEEVDSGPKHTDMHVPEGMMKRVETHDKALEALANIPIHQVSFVNAQLFLRLYMMKIITVQWNLCNPTSEFSNIL